MLKDNFINSTCLSVNLPLILAGVPVIKELDGIFMFSSTVDPAATKQNSPISTPSFKILPFPKRQLSEIFVA